MFTSPFKYASIISGIINSLASFINSSKLKTKKHISYLRWCKIHDMILNKEHLNPIGLDKITLLSTKVNNHLES